MKRMWMMQASNAVYVPPPSDPFDPADLYESGTYKGLWIDASDLSTLKQDTGGTTAVTADGDPVGYVSNKATTPGGALTRITGDTQRPLYKVVGGYSCLQFDGSNDGLEGNATLRTMTSGPVTYWTIVMVSSLASSGVAFNDMAYIFTGSNFNTTYFQYISNTQFGASLANAYTAIPTIVSTDKNVFTIRYSSDGVSSFMNTRVNGVQVDDSSPTVSSLNLGAGNAISMHVGHNGSADYFKGDLYQLYFINKSVTGTDLDNLESYMAAKAGITL